MGQILGHDMYEEGDEDAGECVVTHVLKAASAAYELHTDEHGHVSVKCYCAWCEAERRLENLPEGVVGYVESVQEDGSCIVRTTSEGLARIPTEVWERYVEGCEAERRLDQHVESLIVDGPYPPTERLTEQIRQCGEFPPGFDPLERALGRTMEAGGET